MFSKKKPQPHGRKVFHACPFRRRVCGASPFAAMCAERRRTKSDNKHIYLANIITKSTRLGLKLW